MKKIRGKREWGEGRSSKEEAGGTVDDKREREENREEGEVEKEGVCGRV